MDTVTCQCTAGYFGDGFRCQPCKTCDINANMTYGCIQNRTSDSTTCRCNAGYYGNGTKCTVCQPCDANATLLSMCPGGNTINSATCACNAGYFGSGFQCSKCSAGSYSMAGKTFELHLQMIFLTSICFRAIQMFAMQDL